MSRGAAAVAVPAPFAARVIVLVVTTTATGSAACSTFAQEIAYESARFHKPHAYVGVALGAVTMADMSHLRPDPSSRDIRVSVRVAPQLAARIDILAAHCGQGRSQFIRTSIAFADAAMALAELSALEGDGPLSPDARETRLLATRRLAEIAEALTPTPLPPLT